MTNPTQTFAAMIEIVTACITHQDVSVNDVPGLISKIHKSLSVIDGFTLSLEEKPKRSFVNKAVAKPVMAEDQLPVVTVASATFAESLWHDPEAIPDQMGFTRQLSDYSTRSL